MWYLYLLVNGEGGMMLRPLKAVGHVTMVLSEVSVNGFEIVLLPPQQVRKAPRRGTLFPES